MANLSEKLWIVETIHQHEVEGPCMQLFKTYIVKQIFDHECFLTISNIFDIPNFWRATGTGYGVQRFGNVTSKASAAALNKLGFKLE